MKKIRENVICGCCGEKTEVEIVQSIFIRDYGLDNKPQFSWQLPMIQECPYCHFCSEDISRSATEDIKNKVMLRKYQSAMKDTCSDEYDRKVRAAAELSDDVEDKIYLYLAACWNLEFHGQKEAADEMRKKAVALMEILFEEKSQFEMVLMYIDSLRQLGMFDEAKETVESVRQAAENNLSRKDVSYAIFQFEKELLKISDSKAHMISELIDS